MKQRTVCVRGLHVRLAGPSKLGSVVARHPESVPEKNHQGRPGGSAEANLTVLSGQLCNGLVTGMKRSCSWTVMRFGHPSTCDQFTHYVYGIASARAAHSDQSPVVGEYVMV